MPKRSPLALVALAVLFLSLSRCGSDPQVISTTPNEGTGGFPGGGNGPVSGGRGPGVELPDGGDSNVPSEGGTAGACSGPDCNGIDCGNGVIEDGEICDDGNGRAGDGCSGLCRVEPNFECDEPGEPCVSTVTCGDSLVSGAEACDDGGQAPDDGCDAECQVEPGFACSTPGEPCKPVASAECGDGAVNFGETCDDGDAESDDGCSDECALEPGFRCAEPGEPCEPLQFCGDEKLSDEEDCDDGNTAPGDGCTGRCTLEPFYRCPVPGEACETTIVCGDLEVIGDESCDDGNTVAGDGCAADCKTVEPGYLCPTDGGLGGLCEEAAEEVCGDALVSFGEFCDDGNSNPDDGCTDVCEVTPGYDCPNPGMLCVRIAWCGDGDLSPSNGEQCDDGEDPPVGGDGCSTQCVIEDLWDCLVPGEPCVSRIECGDRVLMGTETCDDGNAQAGDGCSAACQLEDGWICPPGARCRARECGDGIVAGNERCDDDNTDADDGCSATCELEEGFKCDGEPSECEETVCNDGVPEGLEPCDDGNNDMGDGCTPFCQLEPNCGVGGQDACATECGDLIRLASDDETCDDGNTTPNDGCSADCLLEPSSGYECEDVAWADDTIELPLVIRDFRARTRTANNPTQGLPVGHADFEQCAVSGPRAQLVAQLLGNDGKPARNAGQAQLPAGGSCPAYFPITSAETFYDWYRDQRQTPTDPRRNSTVLQSMVLARQGNGSYQFDDSTFYPIDGLGFGNDGNATHNYHFTSEVRYWFQFAGGEVLSFRGDDDVWVFIKGQMVIDLGGVKEVTSGQVTLRTDGDADTNTAIFGATRLDLNLAVGEVYEIVVFQAERHTVDSNYRLTLAGFDATYTQCNPVCGNGIPTPDEACDLGTDENTGEYGGCNADCTLAPFCGDATRQVGQEECDNGANVSTYGAGANACAPGCVLPPRCGDDVVQGAYEACDQGADNGRGYGYCGANCQAGPRCGDGITQSPQEECDDVRGRVIYNGTSSSACSAECQLKCGNGDIDAGEQCDDGEAENVGGYDNCSQTCRLGPRCGDGIRQAGEGEACDDGQNDGDYGECAPGCELGPRCGDGEVQDTAGEECDRGDENVAASYGEDICTTQCKPAPYCGDRAVDVAFGEACDDGVNDGSPGSCETDCSGWVPLPNCGDGNLDAGEQCDDGNQNGTSGSSCDARCRERCGNGVVDPGEECDDGVNDGSFGTCNSDCTLAGYCGDGNRDSPFEQCDEGDDNQDDPYGRGLCTTGCARAPFCGDGRIQSDFGEKCDGGSGCDRTRCVYIIPE
jgi:fibro-slime domain-containing protein